MNEQYKNVYDENKYTDERYAINAFVSGYTFYWGEK